MPTYNKVEIGRVAQQHGFVRDTSYPKVPDLCIAWMPSIISIRMPVATEI